MPFQGHKVEPGQRVSIMLRDKYIAPVSLVPLRYSFNQSASDCPGFAFSFAIQPPASPPSLYGTHGGAGAVLPPSAGEFYTPLSVRDEAVLQGEDFRYADELPWSYAEEKHRLATSVSKVERKADHRQRRFRTNEDLIRQGMKNRKWGGR